MEDDESNEQIRAVPGDHNPRTFGGALPHDRYLISGHNYHPGNCYCLVCRPTRDSESRNESEIQQMKAQRERIEDIMEKNWWVNR